MTGAPSFNPSRLTAARLRRSLTKKALAEKAMISLRSINSYEAGDYDPSPETVVVLAQTLGFPVGFLFGDDLTIPSPDAGSFRAASRMTARQRDAVLVTVGIAERLNDWIERHFDLPKPDVPYLTEEPALAAQRVREGWGLADNAVPNMVHLLEQHGVRVFSLAQDCLTVDAFSCTLDGQPFVFLNTMKTGERSRFDAAHELGHIVLHRSGRQSRDRGMEQEADAFASAFLMPAGPMLATGATNPSLSSVVRMKKPLRVSPGAFVRRLKDLDMISEWTYRSLSVEISKRGWRTSDPDPCAREQSQLLEKVLAGLRSQGRSRKEISDDLHLTEADIGELMFGLTMQALPGGSSSNNATRPELRVV